jgi:type IV secretory pathway VirB3-like protein
MKARSVVFPQLQKPPTMFGLPMKMMGVNFVVTVLFNLGSVAFGAIAISFVGAGMVFVIGLALIYRASRNDHHVETIWWSAFRFWGVSTRRRWLLAGATAPRCSRDGRS